MRTPVLGRSYAEHINVLLNGAVSKHTKARTKRAEAAYNALKAARGRTKRSGAAYKVLWAG